MKLKDFLKQKRLRRREFLIGSGTIITLPFFESLYANNLHAQTSAPLRVLFGHIDTGVHQNARANYAFDQRYVDAFSPVSSYLNYYRGVKNDSADADHSRTIANYSHGGSGTSFDHHAFKINQADTATFNSVANISTNDYVNRDSTWNVSVQNNKRSNPQMNLKDILSSIVVSGNTAPPQASLDKDTKMKNSSLHYIVESMKTLKTKLSPSDKLVLDHHLTLIEEIETLNDNTEREPSSSQCSTFSSIDDSVGFAKRHDLIAQMIAMSFTCDTRRVISMAVGAYLRNPGFEDIPSYNTLVEKIKSKGATFTHTIASLVDQQKLRPGYHPFTHNYEQSVRDKDNKTFLTAAEVTNVRADIGKYYISFFVKIAEHLKNTIDVNGKTVLDNSLIYFGGDMGDATLHGTDHLPTVIIGKAGGKINTGKGKVELTKGTSLTAFQNALLDALGSTDSGKYSNKNSVKSQVNKGIFT